MAGKLLIRIQGLLECNKVTQNMLFAALEAFLVILRSFILTSPFKMAKNQDGGHFWREKYMSLKYALAPRVIYRFIGFRGRAVHF